VRHWPSTVKGIHDRHMVRDDIRVRRICPGDLTDLELFYRDLSSDSRQLRFHGAGRGISRAAAERFAAADHVVRDGFVAVKDGRIVGHLVLEPLGPGAEELALAVADGTQHYGIGTLLMVAAIASARLRSVSRLVALVKAENLAMHRLLAGGRHGLRVSWDGAVARYELALPPAHSELAAA
jgi:GNAT superfamily N-acetyltransferase